MNATLFFVLLATVVFVAVSSSHHEYEDVFPSRVLTEMEMELAMEDLGKPMSRSRRVASKKNCGKHLLKYVLAICGGACTIDSQVNLSTYCCANQCEAQFIMDSCCP